MLILYIIQAIGIMEKTAPGTSEETLERGHLCPGVTFAASLYRSRKSGRVLYLEAGKDFVDTLLSFLLLPLGTIIHMLSAGIQVKPDLGGMSSIFESVQNFSASDLRRKENLLQHRPAAIGCSCRSAGMQVQQALETVGILPSPLQKPGLPGDFYKCEYCGSLAQTSQPAACAYCKSSGLPPGPYSVFEKEPGPYTDGFVKVNTTFIVTDNLDIMPLTTNKIVSVLSRLKVGSIADLEGNDITVNITQILQLLQSALTSNTCLNDVFGSSNESTRKSMAELMTLEISGDDLHRLFKILDVPDCNHVIPRILPVGL